MKALTFVLIVVMGMLLATCGKAEVVEQHIPSTAKAVLETAKKLAEAQYREGKNNDTVMGRWYGLPNQPWCAMFVSWCFKENGMEHLVAAQSKKGFASCAIGLGWFSERKQLVSVEQVKPGDIIFFKFGKSKRPTDHVGIVKAVFPEEGYLLSYEGNTSSGTGSQRDGDGVYLRKRTLTSIVGIARPAYK